MKLTRFESGWLRVFGFLAVVLGGIFFIRPLLPYQPLEEEPLADPVSLALLQETGKLPVPFDETGATFHDVAAIPPRLSTLGSTRKVLGTTSSDKRVEVDLTNQRVYAYEGGRRIYEFVVSTGKWFPTPTGEYRIWAKVRSQKMSGGNRSIGTYYYLPNVPYVMFFANNEIVKSRGFSLHGTYWHENFGHPMSHGCINMKIPDAQTLYEWADPPVTDPKAWSTTTSTDNPGTPVIIYGVTPKE